VAEGQLWPGCRAPSPEDVVELEEDLEELSSEELFALADQVGLLVLEESTTPDILRARIRRAIV